MVPKATPLIVIIGQTASGKSALAMDIAQQFGGEIICADSRTTYKHMDIGTAKPSKTDQAKIPHHLLDVVEPNQRFSVADFKNQAIDTIKGINIRAKVPILVGGSGLYIDSVIFDYKFGGPVDDLERQKLEGLSLEQLSVQAKAKGITEDQIDFANKRHITRAIENQGVIKQHNKLRPNTLVIGIEIDREVLKERISHRVDQMFAAGFASEVRQLTDKYGWDSEALTGIGYRAVRKYLSGEISLDQAKADFVRGDLLLAKKQRTWFKRNKYVHWISNSGQAHALIEDFLNKTN